MVSDITIEQLAEVLADNHRGVLLERDELVGLLGGFGRYSGGKGEAERSHYLSIFNSRTILVDRKTGARKRTRAHKPHVSIFGGIQPELVHEVIGDSDVAAGLPQRFLFAMPPAVPKRWKRPAIPRRHEDAVNRVMNALYDLTPNQWEGGKKRRH